MRYPYASIGAKGSLNYSPDCGDRLPGLWSLEVYCYSGEGVYLHTYINHSFSGEYGAY